MQCKTSAYFSFKIFVFYFNIIRLIKSWIKIVRCIFQIIILLETAMVKVYSIVPDQCAPSSLYPHWTHTHTHTHTLFTPPPLIYQLVVYIFVASVSCLSTPICIVINFSVNKPFLNHQSGVETWYTVELLYIHLHYKYNKRKYSKSAYYLVCKPWECSTGTSICTCYAPCSLHIQHLYIIHCYTLFSIIITVWKCEC